MGIQQKLNSTFDSVAEFAQAAGEGVAEDINTALVPIRNDISTIQSNIQAMQAQLAQLGISVQLAQQTADSAQQTATQTQNSLPTPTPTPSVSPRAGSDGNGDGPGGVTPTPTPSAMPGTTPEPSATPVPTPTPSPRQTVFVLALADPIFIGNILTGEPFRAPATITVAPTEGAFYAGSQLELRYADIDPSVSFVGWYNFDTGAILGTSNPLRVTIPSAEAFNITAKFSLR